MRLCVYLPTEIVVDEQVDKVSAEAEDGYFTLLPRHIDFAAGLVPGILRYERDGAERLLAVDAGVLVNQRDSVRVSTADAIAGDDLAHLERAVAERFEQLDERAARAQLAIHKMEADFVRRFIELEDYGAG